MLNLLIALMPIAFAAALLLLWYQKVEYHCGHCFAVIHLPLLNMIVLPFWMFKKPVVCPNCGMRTWATPFRKEK